MLIEISRVLETDIMNFVKVNEIKDINAFLAGCLRDGFNIAKYGVSPQDNFKNENKPFKIENYDTEEESNTEGVEKPKKRGRPKKQQANEESIIQEEEKVEPIKPKKKITIIKK
jgi:hypothetical protein